MADDVKLTCPHCGGPVKVTDWKILNRYYAGEPPAREDPDEKVYLCDECGRRTTEGHLRFSQGLPRP